MKNRHRVVWTQGMFLTPQHFQSQEQFLEDALHFRFNVSNYANWGVSTLNIDTDALANGLFRVSACSGVMPDGEPVDIPDTDEPPASRALTDHFPPNRESLDVFLALPENRPGTRTVTIPGPEQPGINAGPPKTRYLAETRMIRDENLGDEEKEVQVARRTFRLLFGDEYRDGFTSFRIAQAVRNAAGIPVLNPKFIAPCVDLSSSDYLSGLLRRQIEILATKSSALSAPRRARSKVVADFSPAETANFWLLHTVNSYLPELKHIWKVRHGHPEPAYVAMLRLAGALSTFSLEGHPENLPDYDHDDLGGCFTLLDRRILELMDFLIKQSFVGVPLKLSDRFIWTGAVTEDAYFRDTQFYLSVSAKMGVDEVIRKIPQFVKVTAQEDIQRIVKNALPGIVLRHTPTPPPAIPVKLDYQYFLINQGGALWDGLVRSRNIAVYAPGEIVEAKMEVLIVLE
jgi:type VI secretion system protein ImpJ